MTAEEYDRLSDKEKRILIAKCARLTAQGTNCCTKRKFWVCPDFLRDLNACHDFEQDILLKDDRLLLCYVDKLRSMLDTAEFRGELAMVFATAADKCKAFVLTMTPTEAFSRKGCGWEDADEY